MDLKQLILEANDLAEEVYEVPEWGGAKILLRALTVEQLDRCKRGMPANAAGALAGNVGKYGAKIAIEGIINPETKKPLFDQAELDALMRKNAVVVDRIASKILSLSGATEEAQAEIEKN